MLDADVLDVDARPPGVGEDPGQLARLVADEDGHGLVRGRGRAVLARHPGAAGVAAPQDVLDACHAVEPLLLVGGVQGAQGPYGLLQVGGDAGEDVGHGPGVGGEDVDPHARVGGGDAGDVADALAAQAHGGLVGVPQAGGDQAGEQLRGVRDERDGPVVGVGVHDDGHRAAQRDELEGEVEDLGVGLVGGRQHPRPALEEVGGGRHRPGALAAGHRVGAQIAAEVAAELLELAARPALDARDVEIGAGEPAPDRLGQGRGDVRGRYGHDGQVHAPLGRLVRAGAAGGGGARLGRVVVHQVHLDATAGEGEGGGRADQSGSDDEGGSHTGQPSRGRTFP